MFCTSYMLSQHSGHGLVITCCVPINVVLVMCVIMSVFFIHHSTLPPLINLSHSTGYYSLNLFLDPMDYPATSVINVPNNFPVGFQTNDPEFLAENSALMKAQVLFIGQLTNEP